MHPLTAKYQGMLDAMAHGEHESARPLAIELQRKLETRDLPGVDRVAATSNVAITLSRTSWLEVKACPTH